MNRAILDRLGRAAYWMAPLVFCFALYWLGIRIWFAQDDFAWLNLRNHVTDFKSLLWTLFAPLAQGTIRVFSERIFFMVFSYFFGLHALPFRLFVFLNQLVNVVLVMLVTRKLTKSALAGLLAPLLWLANAALVRPMSWSSTYNEILCSTFLMLSLYLFIYFTETGERKFYLAQWITFVLGFGALEINVVYPAIAGVYALFFARRYVRHTLPMFVFSAAFALIHRQFSAQSNNFYYDLDYHVRPLIDTLIRYWNLLLDVPLYAQLNQSPPWAARLAVLALTAGILGFAAWQTWKRRYLPLFFLSWFLTVLGPLLPLHNHVTDYYLTIPSIGIAMLGAYGISLAWRHGAASTILAMALALAYAVPSVEVIRIEMIHFFDSADRGRAVVQSVAYAKLIHPGKMILLKNIDDALFWEVIYDSPFRIFGWSDVFLTPDCRPMIASDPHFGPIGRYFLQESAAARVLEDGTAMVYSFEDSRKLKNVTLLYTAFIEAQPPPPLSQDIDVGFSYTKGQLGAGWYGAEDGFRWSTQHAVVYLAGPVEPGQRLFVRGLALPKQIETGPLHFALTIDGRPEPVMNIDRANLNFTFNYTLPADIVGRPKIEIAFTLDRTFHAPGDTRDLGMVFGEFSIR
jgi:hypothetical protein